MGTSDRFLNEFVTVRVPTTLLKQMEVWCEKEHKTTSALIREAITDKLSAAKLTKD